MIGASGDLIRVGRADAPSPLAVKVKNTIDRSYRTPRQLSEIAAELGISPAVMSRYFKKAYGLPPVHYRHHLRTMEAMMRLLEGRSVKDVYLDVGFDDLSRFYRHFRDHMVETGAVFVRALAYLVAVGLPLLIHVAGSLPAILMVPEIVQLLPDRALFFSRFRCSP